jgi:hypothetical protein
VQKRPPIISETIVPIEGPRQDIFVKTAVQNFEDAAASPRETPYFLRGIGIVYLHSEKPRHLQISGYVTLL